MAKEVVMKCPGCATIVRGRYGFFNRVFFCDHCRRQIDPKRDANEAITCSNCGNTILYDTTIGKEKRCPVCNISLNDHSITDVEVTCPACHMNQVAKANVDTHTCAICNHTFDVKSALAMKKAATNTDPSVVTVPADNKDIIWVHPMTRFAFASQVVVPEGYTALILRDGVCSVPSAPGRYVLSDTMRSMNQQLERALLDSDAQVSVQILFVRNQIDKSFKWTGQKQTVTDKNGKAVGTLGFGGGISSLRIVDVKLFAEFVGYKTVNADELMDRQMGQMTKLHQFVSVKSFESAFQVMMSAVYNSGFSYQALDANKLTFVSSIKKMTDDKLKEIGVETTLFELDFVTFEEDSDVKADRIVKELEEENFEAIRRYVQHPFTWEAPAVHVHMKKDLTLAADLTFGGDIRFRIRDDIFFQTPDVKYWIKNGISENEIVKYCADLAKVGVSNTIRDILQTMINDTDADIRDLSIYYQYVRENIQDGISRYFAQDGLSIDLFTMEEKSRKQSEALNAKGEVEVHKSKAQIEQDLYAFKQKQIVNKAVIDGETKVDLDTNDLNVQRAMTKNTSGRVQDQVDNMYIKEEIQTAQDDIQRQRDKKYLAWDRADEEDEIDYEHKKIVKTYSREDQIAALDHGVVKRDHVYTRELSAMKHEDVLTEHEREAEIDQAEHAAEMTDYQYKFDIQQAEHRSSMQEIENKTDEKMELHYLNQQEIENHAKELYAQWETKKNMEYESLAHNINMHNTQWAAQKEYAREKDALTHEMQQAAAENERVINQILRKIAESDMELTEKKDAYSRILRNQEAEDSLRNRKNEAEAKDSIYYNEAHMKQALKREEMNLSYDSAKMQHELKRDSNDIFYENEHMKNLLSKEEKEIIDEMTRREHARREAIKEADFGREMLRKEKEIDHEMELLKMEYLYYQREDELNQEIKNKNLEIEKLKMLLEHQENMSAQDIEKRKNELEADASVKKAEYAYGYGRDLAEFKYKTEQEKRDYNYHALQDKLEYRYSMAQDRAEREERAREDRLDREERARMDRLDREERARLDREEREARELRYNDRIGMEKDYLERADRLMTQILTIQAALKDHSLDNEKVGIDAHKDIAIARARAGAEVSKSDVEGRIREMERLMNQMSKNVHSLEESVKKIKKDDKYRGGASYGNNIPPEVGPYGKGHGGKHTGGSYKSSKSGMIVCPSCKTENPSYRVSCSKCGKMF